MRRSLVAFATAVLVACGLVAAGPVVAYARDYAPVKAEVPVAFNVTGDTPKADETFTAIMTPAAVGGREARAGQRERDGRWRGLVRALVQ